MDIYTIVLDLHIDVVGNSVAFRDWDSVHAYALRDFTKRDTSTRAVDIESGIHVVAVTVIKVELDVGCRAVRRSRRRGFDKEIAVVDSRIDTETGSAGPLDGGRPPDGLVDVVVRAEVVVLFARWELFLENVRVALSVRIVPSDDLLVPGTDDGDGIEILFWNRKVGSRDLKACGDTLIGEDADCLFVRPV
ncbi:hypothetical protein [Halospeciosus flavus]|uniref:Uncharacterized protein n=1 Tax=Halospeciosus flavus TaxID=3032283 RepID=A0ABD5Z191_9EURY|nr:hypothetical protein [Halospeciosus flavus]